jgi:SAM-dependent methyltransferase
VWDTLPIYSHERWPTWEALKDEVPRGRCLELGVGVSPRIPLRGGYFVDLSKNALRKLAQLGGLGVRAGGRLPFRDQSFAVVCAFEVLEHIPDDDQALAEIARVLVPDGGFFFSVPVDPALYTYFDRVCEHVRRYDAGVLRDRLAAHGLVLERWATQPNHFTRVEGALAGWSIKALSRWPSLLRRLKDKSMRNIMSRRYVWRSDDVRMSHAEGGLIAVARRAA